MRSDHDESPAGTVVLVGVGGVGISVAREVASTRPGLPLILIDLADSASWVTQPVSSRCVRIDTTEMSEWDCTVPESLDPVFAVGPLRQLVDALPDLEHLHTVFVGATEDRVSEAFGMCCRAAATRGYVSAVLATPSRGADPAVRLRSLDVVEEVDMNVHFCQWLPQIALPDEPEAQLERRSRFDLLRASERCIEAAVARPLPRLHRGIHPVESSLCYDPPNTEVPASMLWSFLARAVHAASTEDETANGRVAWAIATAYGLEPSMPQGFGGPTDLFGTPPGRAFLIERLWHARLCLSAGPRRLEGWLEGHPFAPRHALDELSGPARERIRLAADHAVEALEYCVSGLYGLDEALFVAFGLNPDERVVTVADLWRLAPETRAQIGM